jgi:hypothetical protein
VVKAVRRKLHAIRKALVQVPEKRPRIGAHALADAERGNEFCFRVNRNVNPLVTKFGRIAAAHVAPFLANVAPDFVNLQIPGLQISHLGIHQLLAAFTREKQEPHNRVTMYSRDALNRTKRHSFD